jgi:UPF0042 nucleotide-binding protein
MEGAISDEMNDGSKAGAESALIIVTGMSGAGRSTAIHALEDIGFEAIHNLPLSFVERLSGPDEAGVSGPLAIGLDTRTRGFSAEALAAMIGRLRETAAVAPRLVFLDAAEDALVDRFKETRRRHPLAPEEGAVQGIRRERAILDPVRAKADLVIDTTELTPHDLRERIQTLLGDGGRARMTISLRSFAFKRGAPREADMVLDCRFLRNPHWEAELRESDGRDPAVAAYVAQDTLYTPFLDHLTTMAKMLLPAYRSEGKSYFCIGLGCTGGRHRSVAVAEELKLRLESIGWRAIVRHRELERRG